MIHSTNDESPPPNPYQSPLSQRGRGAGEGRWGVLRNRAIEVGFALPAVVIVGFAWRCLDPEVSRQHPLFGQFVVYFGHAGLFVLLSIVASMMFRRNGHTNRVRLAALIAFYVSSAVLSWFFVVNGALKTMY